MYIHYAYIYIKKQTEIMTNEIKIGSTVNIGGYMKNGVVYGFDSKNNRAFVKWPQHGNSSIPIDQLTF